MGFVPPKKVSLGGPASRTVGRKFSIAGLT